MGATVTEVVNGRGPRPGWTGGQGPDRGERR